MKLFIDTGSVADVEEIAWGVLSGAVTTPSLLAKEQEPPRVRRMADGPRRVRPGGGHLAR